MPSLCLLAVHAHPDDEASKGAGTVARYHDAGVRTVLVTCTGGEEGARAREGRGEHDHVRQVRGFNAGQLRPQAIGRESSPADAFFHAASTSFNGNFGQTFGVGVGFWFLITCSSASLGAVTSSRDAGSPA